MFCWFANQFLSSSFVDYSRKYKQAAEIVYLNYRIRWNCNIVSDILDWTWFLHYFWLQEFIQQQTWRFMNKKKISLTQQIRSLHLKNPLRKYVIRLLVCVPFLLGSICKYWIYVIDGIGIFTTLSDI